MLQCTSGECRFLVYRDAYKGKELRAGDACPWCKHPLTSGDKPAASAPVDQPLVSIIIPIYKGSGWMAGLAQTLREQDYPNIEVVLTGDDCDPATMPEIAYFRGLRFVCVGSPRHQGIALTTNRGIMISKGQLILHMDQDDQLRPTCVSRLVRELVDYPQLGAVYGLQDRVQNGETNAPGRSTYQRLHMIGHNIMGHPVMVRREVMLRCLLDPRDDLAQDLGYNLRLSEECQVGTVQEVLYTWNLHGNNPSLVKKMEQRQRVVGTSKAAAARRLAYPSVCFILPGLGVCGGIRLVLEAANRLKARGWDVWIADIHQGGRCELRARSEAGPAPECFVPLQVPVVGGVPQWCDIAVATGWETVEYALAHEQAGHGYAAWYAQNWEEDWYAASTKRGGEVRHVVACAPHLQKKLEEAYDVQATLIPSAVDFKQFPFHPRHSGCAPAPPRVLIPWRDSRYKNPEKMIAIMRELRDRKICMGKDLLIFSPIPLPGYLQAEFPDALVQINPPQEDIFRTYSLSDMIVTCSKSEGHSVVTLEAMAVGSIPVVQTVGNEMSIVEGTGTLLPDDASPTQYVDAIENLTRVRCNWGAMRRRAREHVEKSFGWDTVVDKWELFLRGVAYERYGQLLDRMTHGMD